MDPDRFVLFCHDVQAYVEAYDPDAFGGRGEAKFTKDATRAKRFPDHGAAMDFWRQRSRVQPTRPDGRPNRPLTAYTTTITAWADPIPGSSVGDGGQDRPRTPKGES